MTSKVGTKENAIKIKPGTFLHAFDLTNEVSFLCQSKEYLVTVATIKCTTFDELRFENYTDKEASLINILPISNCKCATASSVRELTVTLHLHHTRCFSQCQNTKPSDVGKNWNARNDASVASFVNVKNCTKHEVSGNNH